MRRIIATIFRKVKYYHKMRQIEPASSIAGSFAPLLTSGKPQNLHESFRLFLPESQVVPVELPPFWPCRPEPKEPTADPSAGRRAETVVDFAGLFELGE